MKKILTLTVALMLCASAAMAQLSLNIADCAAGPANHAYVNTCTLNTGTAFQFYASMIMPPVTREQFVGTQGVLDIVSAGPSLPDWWRHDTCRPAGFLLAADAGMGGSCQTLWDGVPGAGANLSSLYGVHGPNSLRFLLGQVLPSTDAYDLTGDGVTELSVFRIQVQRTKTLGATACTGCATGVCLQLNEINVQTLTDTPQTFLRLSGAFPGAATFVGYNGGAGDCTGATPTNNRTWGSVKALYR
jgi:hypothetical protein